MYTRLDSCPNCGHTELANDRIIVDHSISKESFALSRCKSCDFLFTNPRPSDENLGKYYESEDYISHTNNGNGLINRLYKAVRTVTLRQKVNLIKSYQPEKGALLDIGCGTGHFLGAAQKAGWRITGVEPDSGARKIAEQETSKPIYSSIQEVPEEGKYNVVTLWHVLEHLSNLGGTLKKLKAVTTKESTLVIAVPNHTSWDGQHYGENWAGYDVPRHLYHFRKETMASLMKRHGFRVIERKPMVFDAYYVSLLSEQYKTGSKRLLSAFRSGWKSNRWAKKNDLEYSSVIYIIKRK